MTIGQNNFDDLTSEHNVNGYTKTVIDDDFKIIEPSDKDKKLHLNYFVRANLSYSVYPFVFPILILLILPFIKSFFSLQVQFLF